MGGVCGSGVRGGGGEGLCEMQDGDFMFYMHMIWLLHTMWEGVQGLVGGAGTDRRGMCDKREGCRGLALCVLTMQAQGLTHLTASASTCAVPNPSMGILAPLDRRTHSGSCTAWAVHKGRHRSVRKRVNNLGICQCRSCAAICGGAVVAWRSVRLACKHAWHTWATASCSAAACSAVLLPR